MCKELSATSCRASIRRTDNFLNSSTQYCKSFGGLDEDVALDIGPTKTGIISPTFLLFLSLI